MQLSTLLEILRQPGATHKKAGVLRILSTLLEILQKYAGAVRPDCGKTFNPS